LDNVSFKLVEDDLDSNDNKKTNLL